ncbi:MAG: helix-turn-helix domain-containing protein [Dysgonomonas sp.]
MQKAGVSERAYQSYEAGNVKPNVQTAKLIAKVLKSNGGKAFLRKGCTQRQKRTSRKEQKRGLRKGNCNIAAGN